jgi:hypothetical protein
LVLKTVGMSWEDLVVATAVVRHADKPDDPRCDRLSG